MRIVAFDLSLTRTGWASPEGCGVLVPPKPFDRGMKRLDWIIGHVETLVGGPAPATLVVLEGYSFASKGRAVFSLGELGGVVRYDLWDLRIPYVDVAPGTLKKYATGRGNAGKEEVLVAAVHRLGYLGHDDNEADATWLRQMALDHYGLSNIAMPKAHRAALAAVEWPKLAEAAVA